MPGAQPTFTSGPSAAANASAKARPGIWSELLTTPVAEWQDLVASQAASFEDWRDAVRHSGYPTPALDLPDEDARALWFDGYVRTYLERDLQALSAVGNLVDYRRLMRVAGQRLGGLVNQAEVARDTALPRVTAQRYLNLLEASFQTLRVHSYAVNRTKRLVKSPKLYWTDPALAIWLSGSEEPTGEHLENLILADLLVWRDGQAPAPEVLFWRTTTDREVDFVIESRRAAPRHRSQGNRTAPTRRHHRPAAVQGGIRGQVRRRAGAPHRRGDAMVG